jgi:hypothetical protein
MDVPAHGDGIVPGSGWPVLAKFAKMTESLADNAKVWVIQVEYANP